MVQYDKACASISTRIDDVRNVDVIVDESQGNGLCFGENTIDKIERKNKMNGL